MTPLSFTVYTFGLSIVAGLLGSLLGLGGGIIVVPGLTLLLHIDIHYAIGASIVSVIATSSGSAASYVKEHMSNIRLSMVLEIATTIGALSGAYLAGVLKGKWLYIIFAIVMGYAAVEMLRNSKSRVKKALPPDPWADKLNLHGEYFDQAENRQIEYRVSRTKIGLLFSYFAGIISGLLGIGGGAIKVPTMNLVMGVPIKVATATSNFMIGVTAAASAGVYFMRGDIDPFIAAPVAAGVLLGSTGGSKLLGRIRSTYIRLAFVAVLVYICWEMLRKGLG
jgi:uncharacterized membrane protein YfcA